MRLFSCFLLILIIHSPSINAYAIDSPLADQDPLMDDAVARNTDDDLSGSTNEGEGGTTANSTPQTPTRTTTTTMPTVGTGQTASTTSTTTTSTTTTTRLWTTPPPPPNPTWAIIGGLTGGIAGLALIGTGVGVYMCYRSSQQRNRTRVRQSVAPEDIPMSSVDNF